MPLCTFACRCVYIFFYTPLAGAPRAVAGGSALPVGGDAPALGRGVPYAGGRGAELERRAGHPALPPGAAGLGRGVVGACAI